MVAAPEGSGRGFWGQRVDSLYVLLVLDALGLLLFGGLMWGYCGG